MFSCVVYDSKVTVMKRNRHIDIMCGCALGVSLLAMPTKTRVLAPHVLLRNIVSFVIQKLCKTSLSLNVTGMLTIMCSCAPGVLLLTMPIKIRVMAPYVFHRDGNE
jgi:hypothetical protein